MRYRSLLDVAVGTHHHQDFRALYAITDKVTGIDIEPDSTGKYEVDSFISCDVDQGLPFGDRSFDIVYSDHTIEHVKNPSFFLAEILRVADKLVFVNCPHQKGDMLKTALRYIPYRKYPHRNRFNLDWFSKRIDRNIWVYDYNLEETMVNIRGRFYLPLIVPREIKLFLRRII